MSATDYTLYLAYNGLVRAVINETLRLFPPVPINARETRAEGVALPYSDPTFPSSDERPFYIPGNTIIMYFPILTQRNKALWGDDADEFDPERWIDPDRIKKYVSNPTMFTPFSAGPRIVSDFSPLTSFCSPTQLLICLNFVVHRSELCLQRDVLLPRSPAATVRPLHPRSAISTRGVAAPTGMDVWKGKAERRKDLAISRDDIIRQGAIYFCFNDSRVLNLVRLSCQGGIWVNFHRAG